MGDMIVPLRGKISSGFGWRVHPVHKTKKFHNGVDIVAKLGTVVVSPADGIVERVWNDIIYGGGLSVIIKHYNGFKSGYAHLSEQLVKVGQIVKQGEVIAKVGSTGVSTGPHLHFTLSNFYGEKVDPTKEIKFE